MPSIHSNLIALKKNIWIVLLCATNLFSPNIAMAMGDPYQSETTRIGVFIRQILIREGLCNNDSDCIKKEIVFADSSTRVNFYIYGISDINVILKIFSFVALEGKSYTSNLPISVMSYSGPKKQYMGIGGLFTKPELKIEVN